MWMNQRWINPKRVQRVETRSLPAGVVVPAPQHSGACGRYQGGPSSAPGCSVLLVGIEHDHIQPPALGPSLWGHSDTRNREDEQWGQSWILCTFSLTQLLFFVFSSISCPQVKPPALNIQSPVTCTGQTSSALPAAGRWGTLRRGLIWNTDFCMTWT